jgi:ABC-type transporter Mla subunit MlaD
MANVTDRLPQVSRELREAETQATTSTELARQSLNRAREDLNELRQTLARISEIGASFDRLAWQLSTLTLGTASEALRSGTGNRPLMALVERLTAMARQCAATVHSLEESVRQAVANVESLLALADHARRALERLAPALGALADAAAKASTRRPVPVTVVVEAAPSPAPAAASSADESLAEIVADGWPSLQRRGSGFKN